MSCGWQVRPGETMCLLFREQTGRAGPGWRGSLGVSQRWVRSGRHTSLSEADRGGEAAGAAAHP